MSYLFDEKNHIHLLDGAPLHGTSTVIKEVMPPFLAKWGAQCASDYIRNNGEERTIGGIPYILTQGHHLIDAVSAWSKVRAEKAKGGTDMHADMEAYVNRMIADFDGKPQLMNDAIEKDPAWEKVQKFAEWSVANVDTFLFTEKNTYSKEVWVGGVVDCVAKMKDGKLAVIDFKSSPSAYFNQFVQCAGYALQLEESGYGSADGQEWKTLPANIESLIIIPFGAKTLKPETIENVTGYKDVFKHIVEVYKYQLSFKNK